MSPTPPEGQDTDLAFHMGFLEVSVVRFSPKKTCFINIPQEWVNHLGVSNNDLLVFEVSTPSEQTSYFSWGGEYSTSAQWESVPSVGINGTLAMQLGLTEGQEVVVRRKEEVLHRCRQVTLKPVSDGDWKILNVNSSYIESNLMNQIRIIWSGMVFPIWIRSGIRVLVKVANVAPSIDPVLLADDTEVVVVPDLDPAASFTRRTSALEPNLSQPTNILDALKLLVSSVSSSMSRAVIPGGSTETSSAVVGPSISCSSSEECSVGPEGSLVCFNELSVVVRALSHAPLSNGGCEDGKVNFKSLFRQPSTVFLSQTLLPVNGDCDSPLTYVATVRKLPSPLAKSEKSVKTDAKNQREAPSESPSKRLWDYEQAVVRVFAIPVTWSCFDFLHGSDTVLVSDILRRQLCLSHANRVVLQSVSSPAHVVESITLHPVTQFDPSVPETTVVAAFTKWISECSVGEHPLVISSGMLVVLPMQNDKEAGFLLMLGLQKDCAQRQKSGGQARAEDYGFLGVDGGPRVLLGGAPNPQMSESRTIPLFGELDPRPLEPKLEVLGGVGSLSERGLSHLELVTSAVPLATLLRGDLPSSVAVLLVTGQKGSGKSTLVRALAGRLAAFPCSAYVHVLQCSTLRGKRADKVQRDWERILAECVFRQPSVLILDDLDVITGSATGPEQEAGPDALYFGRMADVFLWALTYLRDTECSRVAVVVTGRSWESFHPKLTASHGNHVMYTVLNIDAPNKSEREEVLRSLIRQRSHLEEDFSVGRVAVKTEGCYARDLAVVLDRATHSALLRVSGTSEEPERVVLTDEDFESALEDFCPSSLRGLNLKTDSTLNWDDAGGLAEVKQRLQEVFLWPVKYPELFANSPIRPLSGLVLYGAPGTGKTLLAGIVASECGVNFISIKGPELLSKYIGASEQAVRGVFQRAQSAKPCIIFFDEFDSIAPRRGHDSTGVTDRVVNQLLTLLDGVESTTGVYVLAATSRPDLIDPALLRPGRIDKCLYCPFPSEAERVLILQALSRKMELADDVDFPSIAERTEYFTGADLQALLYTSQLEVVHEAYPEPEGDGLLRCSADLWRSSEDGETDFFCTKSTGHASLDGDEERQILQEVRALSEKLVGEGGRRRRTRTESSGPSLTVHQRHLDAALGSTKPSVTRQERARFDAIYTAFRSGSSTSESRSSAGQRVTLA